MSCLLIKNTKRKKSIVKLYAYEKKNVNKQETSFTQKKNTNKFYIMSLLCVNENNENKNM